MNTRNFLLFQTSSILECPSWVLIDHHRHESAFELRMAGVFIAFVVSILDVFERACRCFIVDI